MNAATLIIATVLASLAARKALVSGSVGVSARRRKFERVIERHTGARGLDAQQQLARTLEASLASEPAAKERWAATKARDHARWAARKAALKS